MHSHRAPAGARLPLHALEFRILMALADGPRHGYAIVQEIESRETALRPMYPANLYRRIRDLLAQRYVESADPPAGASADPRRRYFRLTALGRRVAESEAARLRALVVEARTRGLLSAHG